MSKVSKTSQKLPPGQPGPRGRESRQGHLRSLPVYTTLSAQLITQPGGEGERPELVLENTFPTP